jgi:hypothetical protein
MKNKLTYLLSSVGALIIISFFLSSCNDEKNARVEVRLTDAPGDYEEVNIDIQEVQIHSGEGNENSGWISLNINPGVYSLLELTNGLDTLLGTLELPAGKVSQIRLTLGNNNTIKADGETSALSTPSSQQSGLKLNLHATLKEGVTYRLLLDFDVARSIVKNGAGNYILKPVIRTISEATSGAIKGGVSITQSTPAIYAIDGLDTLGTTYADSTGHFLIKGLPAGTYTISFAPASGYSIEAVNDVTVTLGNVTDLGVITVID